MLRGKYAPQILFKAVLSLGGFIGSLSCAEVDVEAPILLSAQWVNAQQIHLIFSEPLSPVGDLQPSATFRLSVAHLEADETVYHDVGYHFPEFESETGQGKKNLRHGGIAVARVEGDESFPEQVNLYLSSPIEVPLCRALERWDAEETEAHIFVHYSGFWPPGIFDEAGNSLEGRRRILGAWNLYDA